MKCGCICHGADYEYVEPLPCCDGTAHHMTEEQYTEIERAALKKDWRN